MDYAETAGSTSYASDAGVASLLLDADQENSYTASDFATTQALSSVSASLGQLWSYALGETVWFAVTNYTRGVPGAVPSLQLWEVRDGATNLVYHSSEEITNTVVALWQTLSNSVPSSAWSRYQSNGAENPRPDETTIVTTPEVMLTGGGSWNRHVSTSGNAVWVFQTSGLNTLGASAGGSFLKVIDDDGNTQLEVAKTDSYQVDAVPSGCEFDDLSGDFWIQYAYEGDTPPTLYASTNLTAAGFVAEDANHEIDAYGLSVQWEQGGASWAACVHQDATHPALFVYAKVTQEGRTVVRHAAPAAYDGGILYSNRLFRPVINGSQLIFAEAVE